MQPTTDHNFSHEDELAIMEGLQHDLPTPTSKNSPPDSPSVYDTLQENTQLIKLADKQIKERLTYGDASISIKDLNSIKSEASKQIQIEKGNVLTTD